LHTLDEMFDDAEMKEADKLLELLSRYSAKERTN